MQRNVRFIIFVSHSAQFDPPNDDKPNMSNSTSTFPVPPHITPFYFGQGVLKEGDATSLYCSVDLGDGPIDFEWFLNGRQVGNHVEGLTVGRFGRRSSILNIDFVRAEHVGKYTCRASNSAGLAYFSAQLEVNGTPNSFPWFLLEFV